MYIASGFFIPIMKKLNDIGILPNQTKYKKPTGNNIGLEAEPASLQELIQEALDDGELTVSGGGGTAQVQSDWDETDILSKAYILNKPNYISQNIGNTDLTLTGDRTVDGNQKILTFQNFNQINHLANDYNVWIDGAASFEVNDLCRFSTGSLDLWAYAGPVAFIAQEGLKIIDPSETMVTGQILYLKSSEDAGAWPVDKYKVGYIDRKLSSMLDIDFTTAAPTDGQYLKYVAASQKWVPHNVPGGSDTNIANTDLDLTGNRVISGNDDYNLRFDDINLFQLTNIDEYINQAEIHTIAADTRLNLKINNNTSKLAGQVLTLVNQTTGECNWDDVPTVIDYSTNEQLTGKKWIDGFNIWEVTVEVNNGATVNIPLSGSIRQVIDIEGVYEQSIYSYPIQAINTIGVMIRVDRADGKITNNSGGNAVVTVRYTKV